MAEDTEQEGEPDLAAAPLQVHPCLFMNPQRRALFANSHILHTNPSKAIQHTIQIALAVFCPRAQRIGHGKHYPKRQKCQVKCKQHNGLVSADWVMLLLANTSGPWNFRREFCVQQESSQGPAESEAEAKAAERRVAQWERSRPPGVSKVDLTTIWGHDKTPRADATSAAPAGAWHH